MLDKKLKYDKLGMYAISSLENPYNYAATMLCRFYGLPNSTKFSIEWIPLTDVCVNSYLMNLPSILSDNLATSIIEYRQKKSLCSDNLTPFYSCSYIIDVICFCTTFPTVGWKWTIQDPYPIHVSHKKIWESRYIPHFYKIFHSIMLPLHQMIFNKKAPRFSYEAAANLLAVGKYFIEKWFTYIMVFGSTIDPCILPLYVSDKILGREISYQTVGKGLTKVLKDGKKSLWPTLPIKCGSFTLPNFFHATKESTQMEALRLHTLPTRKFDPNNVAYNVTIGLKLKAYNHGENYFEDLL